MGILRVNQVSGDETQLSTLGIGTTTPVTGSVFFDGTGDYLTLASSGDFAYGTGDFTWEVWVYVNSFSDNRYVLDHGGNGGTISNGGLGESQFRYYNTTVGTGGVLYTTGFGTLSTSTWYHLAAVRRNGTTSLYTNGILTASASDSHNYGEQGLNIGRYGVGGNEFSGYISNLRILKGTALYTANFTPPTTILEPIQDTVLLCCNNPDSAGAVSLAGIGTSKTITVNGNAVASTFNPGLVRNFTSGTQFSGVAKIDTQGYFVPPSGTTTQRSRGRGVFGGGYTSNVVNTIDFIQIQSQGIAQNFGSLTNSVDVASSCSSSTRGLFAGGATVFTPAVTNINNIDFITIASTGNAVSFGTLSSTRRNASGCSSSTRGLFAGGYTPSFSNVIDYVTIASLGNGVSFGNMTRTTGTYFTQGLSSPTRGVFAGGYAGATPQTDGIDFVTISTLGNTQSFGNLTVARHAGTAVSSSTRGIFAGGRNGGTLQNVIDYITIATTGNAIDFGDLTVARRRISGVSNSIRGVFAGGYNPNFNTIDFITIASTGDATDFGDLTSSRRSPAGLSDSHGGIS